jgi:hypothetical protein
LPEAIDDCVGPENPVQFIDAFVEGLDLGGTGIAGVEPTETGRPAVQHHSARTARQALPDDEVR